MNIKIWFFFAKLANLLDSVWLRVQFFNIVLENRKFDWYSFKGVTYDWKILSELVGNLNNLFLSCLYIWRRYAFWLTSITSLSAPQTTPIIDPPEENTISMHPKNGRRASAKHRTRLRSLRVMLLSLWLLLRASSWATTGSHDIFVILLSQSASGGSRFCMYRSKLSRKTEPGGAGETLPKLGAEALMGGNEWR